MGRSGLMVCRGHSFPLEIGRTTQPPIVGGPYLGKFRWLHPEEALGPLQPRPHLSLPLGGWRAWQGWDHAGLMRALPLPLRSLDIT